MNKTLPIYLSITLLVMIVSGCASTVSRAFSDPSEAVFYPGIKGNYEYLTNTDSDFGERAILGVVDIPFSLVLDTVLLPFDTYDYFKYKDNDKENSANQ